MEIREEQCDHENYYYYPNSCDDIEGWRCGDCDTKAVNDSSFDELKHLGEKIESIMTQLHDYDFIHVTNSDHGYYLRKAVLNKCAIEQKYDQKSIIKFIIEALDEV